MSTEIHIEVDPCLNFDPVLGHLAAKSFAVLISKIVRVIPPLQHSCCIE